MTIAVTVKVHDGIVFASDSATTMTVRDGDGNAKVVNVYNNANKIFNLVKGLPIGAITFGDGSIGNASIATLAKDLRRRLSGGDSAHQDWSLGQEYTIEQVVRRAREFLFDETHAKHIAMGRDPVSNFGFWVGGYSHNSTHSELWQLQIVKGQCLEPILVRAQEDSGINWAGQPEALKRIVLGYSDMVPTVLGQLGMQPETIGVVMNAVRTTSEAQLCSAPMPIQDAIDLARFLTETTIGYSRFTPGAPSVGGPIEIAAITRHEDFKWVERKHYFSTNLNNGGTHAA